MAAGRVLAPGHVTKQDVPWGGGARMVTPGPEIPDPEARIGEHEPRLNWRNAALLIGLLSVAGWGIILLVSGWLLG